MDLIFFSYVLFLASHGSAEKREALMHAHTCSLPSSDLAMVMHLVFGSWVVMAFSSSSIVPFFFNFLTREGLIHATS